MKVAVLGAGMYVLGRGVGTGTILSSLAEHLRGDDSSEVVVIARRADNAAALREVIETVNRRLGTTLRARYVSVGANLPQEIGELCKRERFDASIVCIPDDLHLVGVEGFLRSRVHCLVVKPMAADLGAAQEMLRLQRDNRVLGMVEFHKRYDEANLYAKRMLAANDLGKVAYVSVEYSQQIRIPTEIFSEWAARTNVFQYLATHYVDLIYFLTRALPVGVTAVGTKGILKARGIDTHDSVHALVRWCGSGSHEAFVSQISVNWIDPNNTSALSDQRYTIVGARGRLELDQKNRGIQVTHESRGVQAVNPYFSEFLPDCDEGRERYQGYGPTSIATFLNDVRAVQSGRIVPADLEGIRPTFADGLVSTAVLDGVNRSLRGNGRWVDLDVPRPGRSRVAGEAGGLRPALTVGSGQ